MLYLWEISNNSYKMQEKDGKYIFEVVKVGDKGQIVIPKDARNIYGIKPGDTLLLLGDEERGIAIPPKSMFSGIVAST